MIGTAWATFPTSSSVCIIFLIRPYKQTMSWYHQSPKIIDENKTIFLFVGTVYKRLLLTAGNLALYFLFLEGIVIIRSLKHQLNNKISSLHHQNVNTSRAFLRL